MPLSPETPGEVLLKFLRGTPRSTQACRDHMDTEKRLTSVETEELLVELRDAGAIAYANGEWYVARSTRAKTRKRAVKKTHARQTDFFDSDAGHRYEGPSKRLLAIAKEWRAERCSR